MTIQRYHEVEEQSKPLTPEESALGWHFCAEFDSLLVGPGMSELHMCRCLPREHKVYATAPVVQELTAEEAEGLFPV